LLHHVLLRHSAGLLRLLHLLRLAGLLLHGRRHTLSSLLLHLRRALLPRLLRLRLTHRSRHRSIIERCKTG